MTKTARVYKIEMLIRNRGNVSFKTLLDELEVSPATLKRDLEYLRDQLGAPSWSRRYSRSRFRVAGETSSSSSSVLKLTWPRLRMSLSIL